MQSFLLGVLISVLFFSQTAQKPAALPPVARIDSALFAAPAPIVVPERLVSALSPAAAAPPPAVAAPPAERPSAVQRGPAPPRYSSVARFRDPAMRCTKNPFLASWSDADFAAAAEGLVAWRASIVHLTHEVTWRAHPGRPAPSTHKPYASLPPVFNVSGCARYGSGNGGKWVCDAAALGSGCNVYSLGSDGDVSFEAGIGAAAPGCSIHTLDCTIPAERVPRQETLPPRTSFHPICLGSDDAPDAQFRSLRSIMREFGHTSVDLLKVDIEGFEYRVVEALMRTFLDEGSAVSLPWQLLMEQHYLTNTEVGWGKGQDPGLSSGDMAILWLNLVDMGYVLVHREDQSECAYCTELSALRVFCS